MPSINQQELFFEDRKKVLSPAKTARRESYGTDDDDSSSDSGNDDTVTTAIVTNNKADDATSSSDASDSSSANGASIYIRDDTAPFSDTSDDEVIFNVSANKRKANKLMPVRSKVRKEPVVKKTPKKQPKGMERTPETKTVAASLTTEPCLPQTDKENRQTSRGNCTLAYTALKNGRKSTPQKITPRKAAKTVCVHVF